MHTHKNVPVASRGSDSLGRIVTGMVMLFSPSFTKQTSTSSLRSITLYSGSLNRTVMPTIQNVLEVV